MRRKLAITQPYVPAYRYPLWDGVISSLRDDGIDARLFFGGDEEQLAIRARRGDGVEAPWAEQVDARTVRVSSKLPKLMYRRLPREWARAALVTEMQGSNGNAWLAMARRQPYVTFGHGAEYTSGGGRLSASLESALNRRAAHVLTYLPSGRGEVLRRTGLADHRVTSFDNSTDTRSLTQAIDAQGARALQVFRAKHGIPASARAALFLGAMNEHKRIELLVDAARIVFDRDPDAWLIAVGDGPLAPVLRALADDTGRVTMLGQAGPAEYAPAAKLSSFLVNPGRIGLIAVDALAMRLPVLTTSFDRHAPEAEYLVEGETMLVSDGTPAAYAELWGHAVVSPDLAWGRAPTVERSVTTISAVLRKVAFAQ